MSTQMSAAQAAQQGNRSTDGKYSFGTHAEPLGLSLGAPQAIPFIRLRQTTADELLERSHLYEGRYLQTDSTDSRGRLAQGYFVEAREMDEHAMSVTLNIGTRDKPLLDSVRVPRGDDPLGRPWTVTAHVPDTIMDELDAPASPASDPIPDGHRVPVDMNDARRLGFEARYPDVSREMVDSIHARLEEARAKDWDSGVLAEIEKMVEQEKISEPMIWDIKTSLGDQGLNPSGNSYPRLGGLRQADALALEASGATFDNSFIDYETGRLTLNTRQGPMQVRANGSGRLEIRQEDRWQAAAPGQSDAQHWRAHVHAAVDFYAVDSMDNHMLNGEMSGSFDETSGAAHFEWKDGERIVGFGYTPAGGVVFDNPVDAAGHRAFYASAGSRETSTQEVKDRLAVRASRARQLMIWNPMVAESRAQHRTGRIQNKFQRRRVFENTQKNLAEFSPGVRLRSFAGGAGLSTSTSKWDAVVAIRSNGEEVRTINGRPAAESEFTTPKQKALLTVFRGRSETLLDLAEASHRGLE